MHKRASFPILLKMRPQQLHLDRVSMRHKCRLINLEANRSISKENVLENVLENVQVQHPLSSIIEHSSFSVS